MARGLFLEKLKRARLEPPKKVYRPLGPAGYGATPRFLAAVRSAKPPLASGTWARWIIQGPLAKTAHFPAWKSASIWAVFFSRLSAGT